MMEDLENQDPTVVVALQHRAKATANAKNLERPPIAQPINNTVIAIDAGRPPTPRAQSPLPGSAANTSVPPVVRLDVAAPARFSPRGSRGRSGQRSPRSMTPPAT